MKSINQSKTFTVELTEAEVELIHELTQNCDPINRQTLKDTYLHLFVGMGRLLGKNLDSDGTWAPQSKG